MLSERELRVLREIEKHTAREDPRFALSMRRALPVNEARTARCYQVVIAAAVLTVVICLVLGLLGAGLLAASVAVGTALLRPLPPAASIHRRW
ncbi:DUF3040 domain-containing protein [Pseudonocardia sp. RS11V-5]|uniref:DUF3040 domain-containing protein n=1 Tax=Pseudonocardia terrae TaxID=2905831 RepID=UPI001E35E53B|nr:DUF3040 domain-containing protein [Pseudonocardia terrae]MCE3551815.1 DUF3040 domain-containing protein [Pseudonocardia terrae]